MTKTSKESSDKRSKKEETRIKRQKEKQAPRACLFVLAFPDQRVLWLNIGLPLSRRLDDQYFKMDDDAVNVTCIFELIEKPAFL